MNQPAAPRSTASTTPPPPPGLPPDAAADRSPPPDELDGLLRTWHAEQSAAAGAVRQRVLDAALAPSPTAPTITTRVRTFRGYGALIAATLVLAAVPIVLRVTTPSTPPPSVDQAGARAEQMLAKSSSENTYAGLPPSATTAVAAADANALAESAPAGFATRGRADARRAETILEPRLLDAVRQQTSVQQLPRLQQTTLRVRVLVDRITPDLAQRTRELGLQIEHEDPAASTLLGSILPEDTWRLAEFDRVTRVELRDAAAPATPPAPASP